MPLTSFDAYLEETNASTQVRSSMTPTCVSSSTRTVGIFNALGRRARQYVLWESSNV